MPLIGVLSAIVGVSVWFAGSTFVPFATEREITYVLCTQPFLRLIVDIAMAAGLLVILCLALESTILQSDKPSRATLFSSRLFMPLALVVSNLASLGLLSPTLRDRWAPIAYVGSSLYPVLWLAAIALVARNVYLASQNEWFEPWVTRWRFLDASTQSLLLDASIAALLAGVVIASSPKIRFSGVPVGDEPKYLRYAENWWQGRGMDMDGVRDASDIPASAQGPRFLNNFSGLMPQLRRDVSQLAGDISYLGNVKHWGHQFNKATYVGNWFVTGKNGGLYQIHQPGISVVILPAYAIDRWLFDRGRGRLADDLFAVNTVMLLIYLVVACVTFRLVNRVADDRGIAAVATVGCLASLPLAAFAFQFYPETLGAVLVAAIVYRSLDAAPITRLEALGSGIALGWLVWLQVRFALLAGTLFLWMLWDARRNRRAWLPLIAVSAFTVGLFCFYVYHVTGSVLPSALYNATPDPGFRASRLPTGLAGILFDRENGLFALAPFFLLALPGFGMLLRGQPQIALKIISLFIALMVPVAGHGYETSGTSPLRHMVAVVPLAAVPAAAWLRAVKNRPLLSALAAVLTLISIHMAIAYDLQNDKTIMQAVAHGISGWDPSLAFPLLRRIAQSGFDKQSFVAWGALSLVGIGIGWRWPATGDAHSARPISLGSVSGAFAIVALAGVGAVLAGGPPRELRLLKPAYESLRECQQNCGSDGEKLQIGAPPETAGKP